MVGAIEAGHERLQTSLEQRGVAATPTVILTGGSAFRLLDHLHCQATVIETLALEGVYLIGTAS
jgi:hypothetical protein